MRGGSGSCGGGRGGGGCGGWHGLLMVCSGRVGWYGWSRLRAGAARACGGGGGGMWRDPGEPCKRPLFRLQGARAGVGHGGGVGWSGVDCRSGCVALWLGSSAGDVWVVGVGPVVAVSAFGGDVGLGGVQVGQKRGSMCPCGHVVGGLGRPCGMGSSCVVVCRGVLGGLPSSRVAG